MNKTLGTLIVATLLLSIVGCTETKTITSTEQTPPVASNNTVTISQFETINSQESSSVVGSMEVVCHNCQAHFKLSPQIQKMSMKGDAIVDCPVCHKNYLGK